MAWRAILVLGMLLGTGDASDKELAKWKGTWKVARMEVNGVNIPLTAFAKVTVVIDGDKMSFRDKGKTYDEIQCVLDTAKNPPQIDLHYVAGLKKGVVEQGIYALDGDTLKVCQSLTAKKRPKELESPKGAAQQLMVLKRLGK